MPSKDNVIDVDALEDDEIQYVGRTQTFRPTGARFDLTRSPDRRHAPSTSRRLPSVVPTTMSHSHSQIPYSSTASFSRTQPIASTSRLGASTAAPDSRQNSAVAHILERAADRPKRPQPKALSMPPPAKRARNAVATTSTGKRLRSPLVIDLVDSDDEDIKPSKRVKQESRRMPSPIPARPATPLPPTDSEEEYAELHAGFDVRNSANWKPPPKPLWASGTNVDQALATFMSTLSLTTTTRRRRPKTLRGTLVEPPVVVEHLPSLEGETRQMWENFKNSWLDPKYRNNLNRYGRDQRAGGAQPSLKAISLSARTTGSLVLSSSFRQASGAINRVAQSRGFIAISSATPGGQHEDDGEPPLTLDSQNREGTLQLWQRGSSRTLHGHKKELQLSNGALAVKHYTVNDVKFDPNEPSWMATSGNDGTVRLWKSGIECKSLEYPEAPHDVSYRPRDSALAVACRDGQVYVHPMHGFSASCTSLLVPPAGTPQAAGAMVWGCGSTNDMLFASSEPKECDDWTGHHKAFDVPKEQMAYQLDAKENGDAMALDPEGTRLALITCGKEDVHILRLYDVGRRNGRRAIENFALEPFRFSSFRYTGSIPPGGEVTTASFSPDGTLLAVARNDNELHVYDVRFMDRGPLGMYRHWGEDRGVGTDRWGVTEAAWVTGWQGCGLGLVSGGSDGCVRLWDVRRSDQDIRNGEVLAQTDYDVGHFSLGDPYKGEKPLVVGDNGARIYIYDRNNEDTLP